MLSGLPALGERYVTNPELPVVKPGWPGNRMVMGRFSHPGFDPPMPILEFFRWQVSTNPQRREKRDDPWRAPVHPNRDVFDLPEGHMAWLGHASFLVHLGGVRILTDPCLAGPPFVRRWAPPPCSLADVRNVDLLLVSHAHQDHMDPKTVRRLGPRCRALLPLNMGRTVRGTNPDLPVQEAGWWQRYTLASEVEITLLPALHWSARLGVDINHALWGSYLLRHGETTVYFAGDTGYGPHFAETGELFPGIGTALVPVGAYKPAYIMRGHHMSPERAVQAARDLGAAEMVPMHYGTFSLSDEPPGEPVRRLVELEREGALPCPLRFAEIGEVVPL